MNTRILIKPLVAVLMIVALLPVVSEAAMVVRADEQVSVDSEEVVPGNFYGLGQVVTMSGTVIGDSILIGGSIVTNGTIMEDLLMIGGTTQVHASVTEDVRIVGGETTIAKDVGGDVVVVGGLVRILSSAHVAGDVFVLGGEAMLEGDIDGSVFGMVEKIRIDSTVAGDIDVTTEQLTLGEKSVIHGSVTYASVNELIRSPQAVVDGEIIKTAKPMVEVNAFNWRATTLGFLVVLFASVLLFLLFRRQALTVAVLTSEQPLRMFLFGLLVLIFTLPVVILITVSVLAALVGVSVLLLWILFLLLSAIMVSISAASWIVKYQKEATEVSVLHVVLAALVLHVILLIPVLGAICYLALFLMTLGALAVRLYQSAG